MARSSVHCPTTTVPISHCTAVVVTTSLPGHPALNVTTSFLLTLSACSRWEGGSAPFHPRSLPTTTTARQTRQRANVRTAANCWQLLLLTTCKPSVRSNQPFHSERSLVQQARPSPRPPIGFINIVPLSVTTATPHRPATPRSRTYHVHSSIAPSCHQVATNTAPCHRPTRTDAPTARPAQRPIPCSTTTSQPRPPIGFINTPTVMPSDDCSTATRTSPQ